MASTPQNDWFIRSWMQSKGMSQADLERATGWDKRKASHLVRGIQDYKRTELNTAARALNIEPWELLMHPEDANRIKRMRSMVDEEARLRLAEGRQDFAPAPTEEPGKKAG